MALQTIPNDVYVNGSLSARTMAAPAESVNAAAIATNAKIPTSKLRHRFAPTYSQEAATDAAADNQVLHVVKGFVGEVVDFRVGCVVAASGGGNAVVDLRKNGSTILTATITIDSTNTAYTVEQPAGYTSTSLVTGDVLSVVVVSASATKPKGLFAQLIVDEDAN